MKVLISEGRARFWQNDQNVYFLRTCIIFDLKGIL